MTKINFEIKYRPEIEPGKYKVVTGDGNPVDIIKWDMKHKCPILAIIHIEDRKESYAAFTKTGETLSTPREKLFILTDEQENLTEFEKRVKEIADCKEDCSYDYSIYKTLAKELLDIANKELKLPRFRVGDVVREKVGATINGWNKTIRYISDVSYHFDYIIDGKERGGGCFSRKDEDKYVLVRPDEDFEEALKIEYERGKADALKDLPRWKKHKEASERLAAVWNDAITPWLDWGGHRIAVRDLEKLPGFKEE